jgi:hypothetical protein
MRRSIAKLSTTCPVCLAQAKYPTTFRDQEEAPTFCSAKNLVAQLVGLMQELQRKLSNTNLELIIIRMQVMKEREPTTEAKRSWM